MSKHIGNTTRDIKHWLIPQKAWCPSDAPDTFCYSITCEDGMKGILITGGLAGVHEFKPLFPLFFCVK
jgi:hypothetical protein